MLNWTLALALSSLEIETKVLIAFLISLLARRLITRRASLFRSSFLAEVVFGIDICLRYRVLKIVSRKKRTSKLFFDNS